MDDYAKILCEQFGYNFEDCFWIGDDRTDCFALGDSGYFITMADIINIVEGQMKEIMEYYRHFKGRHPENFLIQ